MSSKYYMACLAFKGTTDAAGKLFMAECDSPYDLASIHNRHFTDEPVCDGVVYYMDLVEMNERAMRACNLPKIWKSGREVPHPAFQDCAGAHHSKYPTDGGT